MPSIILIVFSYLKNPADVCRQKCVNTFCRRIVRENEHAFMRDAVRAGGMSDEERPRFWLWLTLVRVQDCDKNLASDGDRAEHDDEITMNASNCLETFELF
mmetsp:Transcript_30084/g.34614  ORF Transcript_30084/g.34614 Transcript_30084/m.34614 type:complete len:101 (+) Transcript_30084:691-993(+)